MIFDKSTNDGWTLYKKGQHPVGVFMDGSLVRITGIQLTETGHYNIRWNSSYLNTFKDRETHNIPKFLITVKSPLQFKPIPKEGTWFITAAISGRNFLRENTTDEWQKAVLHLKREIDIANTGLLFYQEKIRDNERAKFVNEMQIFWEACKRFNSFTQGKEYDKFMMINNYDHLFKTYIQLAKEKEPITFTSFNKIMHNLSYGDIPKINGGNNGSL